MFLSIGIGSLICILALSFVVFKRVRKKQVRESEGDVANAIEVASPTLQGASADVASPTGMVSSLANGFTIATSGLQIVAQENDDMENESNSNNNSNNNNNNDLPQFGAQPETRTLTTVGENDDNVDVFEENPFEIFTKVDHNPAVTKSGNTPTGTITSNGESFGKEKTSVGKKNPRVAPIKIDETVTYYGAGTTPQAHLPAAIATPTGGVKNDQTTTDIDAPLSPLMAAMKGYETEELSLSTRARNAMSPTAPTVATNYAARMAIIQADDSSDEN